MAELSTIITDVRIALDYNESQSGIEGLGSPDQLNLDDIIENQVEAAARLVMLSAPRNYINWVAIDLTDPLKKGSGSNGVYTIPLPDDFLRFGAAKLTNWARAIDIYSGVDSDAYAMQQSEFAGIKATRRKPVAILAEKATGGNEVQLYPFTTEDSLQFFTYCKQPDIYIDTNDNNKKKIDLTKTLYKPFIYMTASLVAEVLKDTDKSNELMAGAKAMLTNPDEVVEQTNQ